MHSDMQYTCTSTSLQKKPPTQGAKNGPDGKKKKNQVEKFGKNLKNEVFPKNFPLLNSHPVCPASRRCHAGFVWASLLALLMMR